MTRSRENDGTAGPRPLRLWPGVVAVTLQWLLWLVLPLVVPGNTAGMIGAMAGLLFGLVVAVWWAFFSRAPRLERWGGLALMVLAVLAARPLLHPSIAEGGMGFLFPVYAVPVLSLAFVAWAVLGRRLPAGPRRAAMVAVVLAACGGWAFVRSNGTYGTGTDFAWRWSPTAEERLLARAGEETLAPAPAPMALQAEAEWPGFRGPRRDGVAAAVRIATDWEASPPAELWRRPVGPGWSSFAVHGERLYTQEQRGEEELVSCYSARTGEPLWRHGDSARFWESQGGAGPRATPTLAAGRLYALGATGILNALEAGDGTRVWSRDVAADTGVEVPYWGFSGSPLVVEELVVVAAAGRLAAYESATGELRWLGPEGGGGYSSPHLVALGGVLQVLLMGESGTVALAPADGELLWEHAWPGYPIVQPALTAGGDLLLSATERAGLRRLAPALGDDGWAVEERWTTNRLKPYFNDFVVHEGHAYGFDGSILAAVELEGGTRAWKGGRYGQGQLVLLPDQDLLLVVSEHGELILVEAAPAGHRELARIPALGGKTWNHPVVVGDLLLLRNDQEMAAYRLPAASG